MERLDTICWGVPFVAVGVSCELLRDGREDGMALARMITNELLHRGHTHSKTRRGSLWGCATGPASTAVQHPSRATNNKLAQTE